MSTFFAQPNGCDSRRFRVCQALPMCDWPKVSDNERVFKVGTRPLAIVCSFVCVKSTATTERSTMLYSHFPPARVNLRPFTATGERTLDFVADWPCGWTHFIVDPDFSDRATVREALYAYRLAVIACETFVPEAVDHIAHLRSMRNLYAQSVAWDSMVAQYRGLSFTRVDTIALPMHGPVAENMDDYASRADRLRDDARALIQRAEAIERRAYRIADSMSVPSVRFAAPTVERVIIEPDTYLRDGTWVAYAPAEDWILAEGFGSAAAASNWIDDNVTLTGRN